LTTPTTTSVGCTNDAASAVVAAFVLPAFGPFAWLREHTVGVFAAACSLAAAYIAGNAVMDRWHAGEGGCGN
jgi:hypothetical protein